VDTGRELASWGAVTISPPAPQHTRPAAGRFAPSPSGDLHVGNLRTAVLAWLFAVTTGRRFLLRVEDLDRVRPGAEERQLADLAALGLEWAEPVLHQSGRRATYDAAIDSLTDAGLTYPCFCTRREMLEAASAPHPEPDDIATAGRAARPPADGAYPGTCRALSAAEVDARRAAGRPSATRLRAAVHRWTVRDEFAGSYTGAVDDVVLRRNDGIAAYNLAVVVDDAAQGVEEVVRGSDLADSTPRQLWLARALGLPELAYAHVPLVLGPDGARLAKRHGDVTLREVGADAALAWMALSLGLRGAGPRAWLAEFDPARLPTADTVFTPRTVDSSG